MQDDADGERPSQSQQLGLVQGLGLGWERSQSIKALAKTYD